MSVQQYSGYSQYYNTPQTSSYLDIYVDRGFESDITDDIITLPSKYKHRPDLLAYDYYGVSDLLYIFFLVNEDIIDPIFDLKPGIKIRVPLKSRVLEFFGN